MAAARVVSSDNMNRLQKHKWNLQWKWVDISNDILIDISNAKWADIHWMYFLI